MQMCPGALKDWRRNSLRLERNWMEADSCHASFQGILATGECLPLQASVNRKNSSRWYTCGPVR